MHISGVLSKLMTNQNAFFGLLKPKKPNNLNRKKNRDLPIHFTFFFVSWTSVIDVNKFPNFVATENDDHIRNEIKN